MMDDGKQQSQLASAKRPRSNNGDDDDDVVASSGSRPRVAVCAANASADTSSSIFISATIAEEETEMAVATSSVGHQDSSSRRRNSLIEELELVNTRRITLQQELSKLDRDKDRIMKALQHEERKHESQQQPSTNTSDGGISNMTKTEDKEAEEEAQQHRHYSDNLNNNTYIPNEVVGTISKFLDINSVSNLLQVIHQKQRRTFIKNYYLKCNLYFLEQDVTDCLSHRVRILAWMEVNPDWKQMYDNPKQHGILTTNGQSVFNKIFNDILIAVGFCLYDIVNHLVQHRGVDINACSVRHDNGQTIHPLLCAVNNANLSMLELLLSYKNIKVNKVLCGLYGNSLLHFIAHPSSPCTDPKKLRMVLSHPKVIVDIHNFDGVTPLHYVCGCPLNSSSIWKLQILIEFQADVNIRDRAGLTALDVLRANQQPGNSDGIKEKMIDLLQLITEY